MYYQKLKNKNLTKGFTVAELLISLAILAFVGTAVTRFERDLFSFSFIAQDNLSTQQDARHLVKIMVTALREAQPSANGGYPIALASSSAITFYADPNNDGTADQIRYFISGTSLMQGVTIPTGTPPTYQSGNEKITTVASKLTNAASSTAPIFEYYDENYAGTGTALAQPVDPQAIRLIKITLIINKDPIKTPNAITITSQAEVRNLKGNL